jgi:hypothetical protein
MMAPSSEAAAEFRWSPDKRFFHSQHPAFSKFVALPTYDPGFFFACFPIPNSKSDEYLASPVFALWF